MSLPVPNLDDRKFQQLVDEAKRAIPEHCPEWTNHNLSDPGVAILELFAWMTELAIFRLNQVPDTFYTRMLNLMGFEPFAATAARADVTFWLVAALPQPITIPAGTHVATAGDIGPTRVFTTLEDLFIRQPTLISAQTSTGPEQHQNVWEPLRLGKSSIKLFPRDTVSAGDSFYLGFEESLAGNALQLDFTAPVEGIGVRPETPPLSWELYLEETWVNVPVYRDTTGGLNRNGSIVLLLPNKHEPSTVGGERAYWLRVKLLPTAPGQPAYRASPQIQSLQVSSIGGTVTAEHSDFAPREFLGVSTGKPDQVFRCRNTPVMPRSDSEYLVVVDGKDSQHWAEVRDFTNSDEKSKHYMWDSATGEIRFGPQIRYPDIHGTFRQHGAIPPAGAQLYVTGYRYGGGDLGNVGARTIRSLRTTIPYVSRVENVKPARGGVDPETIENAKRRAPQSLRTGGRAVTIADFERLTKEADPAIARVRCLPPDPDPNHPGGKPTEHQPIRLLIVPSVNQRPEDLDIDHFALPERMTNNVRAYLDERRVLGTRIEIGTPYYQGVTIVALLTARPARPAEGVEERARAALYRFLNPLPSDENDGWPFDTDLNSTSVFQLLESVDGVERVEDVLFFEYDLRNKERIGYGKQLVKLAPQSLFLSAHHQVVVR
jgi:predicted phage baseplate assembly protein